MKRSLKDLTVKELEKVLDKWFSRFIRLRDSDENGVISCCTCNRFKTWNVGVDCGHYSKRNKRHRFSEINMAAQCKFCNSRMKGEADKFALYIDKKYGEGTAQRLRATENQLKTYTRFDYLEMIKLYKEKAKLEAKRRSITGV